MQAIRTGYSVETTRRFHYMVETTRRFHPVSARLQLFPGQLLHESIEHLILSWYLP